MAFGHGIGARFGLVDRSSWDAVFATVTSFVPFLDETLTANFERIQQMSLEGFGGRLPSEQGNLTVGGTINHEMDYTNMVQYLEYCMGADSGTVLTITDLLGKWAFLEFDKLVERSRFGSGKMMKFVLSGEKDGIVKLAADWFVKDYDGVATAQGTPAYTLGPKIYFKDMVFRIADQADALQASDEINIESFEITFDRVPKTDDYASDATAPQLPLEALENDFRVCSIAIKAPRFNDDNKHILTWKASSPETALQADLTFTGAANTFTVQLPEIRITEGFNGNIAGPGIIPLEGTLEAYRNTNASHPMTSAISNEMLIAYT